MAKQAKCNDYLYKVIDTKNDTVYIETDSFAKARDLYAEKLLSGCSGLKFLKVVVEVYPREWLLSDDEEREFYCGEVRQA